MRSPLFRDTPEALLAQQELYDAVDKITSHVTPNIRKPSYELVDHPKGRRWTAARVTHMLGDIELFDLPPTPENPVEGGVPTRLTFLTRGSDMVALSLVPLADDGDVQMRVYDMGNSRRCGGIAREVIMFAAGLEQGMSAGE